MALITPEFLWTKKYSAKRDRLAFHHGGAIQAGVWGSISTDFKATQRAAGANMSVDVDVGYALVKADSAGNLGLYHVQNDAIVNVTVTASHASLPRIDQLFVEINDTTDGGDGSDTPQFTVVAGTPTGGATLDNRTGVGTVPNNALRLADILVPAASTTVTTANIRDRRPWARGAHRGIKRATSNYTTTSTTFVVVDSTNLAPRIECSGAPIRVSYQSVVTNSAPASSLTEVDIRVDGVQANDLYVSARPVNAGENIPVAIMGEFTPSAGSHIIAPYFRASAAATATLIANATHGLQFVIEELVRTDADNT